MTLLSDTEGEIFKEGKNGTRKKVYNKYELKSMLIAIKNALFKGIEAKPKYLPCCKIYGDKVKEYKYLHKNECTGFLYEGELNGKKII